MEIAANADGIKRKQASSTQSSFFIFFHPFKFIHDYYTMISNPASIKTNIRANSAGIFLEYGFISQKILLKESDSWEIRCSVFSFKSVMAFR